MVTRRSVMASLGAALFTLRGARASRTAPVSRIFIGTSGHVSKGIYTASWNPITGELGTPRLAAELASPSFLAAERNRLYACSEVGAGAARVAAYDITSEGLAKLNEQPSLGDGTTFVSAKGKGVFAANYSGGSVTSFHTERDGSLSRPVSHFKFQGSGPNHERQEHSHAHSALPSPDGRFLLVNDLGLDRIFIYRVQASTSTLTPHHPPFFSARPGSGPRHIAWHPNGKWLYSVNELDSTVDLLDWNASEGALKQGPYVSTLQPEFPPNTAFAGEIVISSDGLFLYVGNRVASDTIAVFAIDRTSGTLTLSQLASNGGKNTRHCTIDPSGRWMLLCNQDSNDLVVLSRDRGTGRLSEPKHIYPLDTPQCIVFA